MKIKTERIIKTVDIETGIRNGMERAIAARKEEYERFSNGAHRSGGWDTKYFAAWRKLERNPYVKKPSINKAGRLRISFETFPDNKEERAMEIVKQWVFEAEEALKTH